MPISVVCPGCHTRFQVSDRFAGKTGGCPKCKTPIRVPTKEEEVTVHAPEEFSGGGRGASGRLALKPLPRLETKLTPLLATIILSAVLGVMLLAWLAGPMLEQSPFLRAIGLILVSPTLVWAGYTFLRDQEREAYQGQSLYLRVGIASLSYIILWGMFAHLSDYMVLDQAWSWLIFGAPFVVVGAVTAYSCFDLDFGTGAFHYGFYVLVTVILRWCAGMGWIWQPII